MGEIPGALPMHADETFDADRPNQLRSHLSCLLCDPFPGEISKFVF
jgi:hypothetical protein